MRKNAFRQFFGLKAEFKSVRRKDNCRLKCLDRVTNILNPSSGIVIEAYLFDVLAAQNIYVLLGSKVRGFKYCKIKRKIKHSVREIIAWSF